MNENETRLLASWYNSKCKNARKNGAIHILDLKWIHDSFEQKEKVLENLYSLIPGEIESSSIASNSSNQEVIDLTFSDSESPAEGFCFFEIICLLCVFVSIFILVFIGNKKKMKLKKSRLILNQMEKVYCDYLIV